MRKRVVVTGMGVAAPNAHGLEDFEQALREGRSGIRFIPQLEELKFGCQIAGVPQDFDAIRKSYFDHEKLMSINDNIGYASVSAVDAWKDAGFSLPEDNDTVDWDTGVIAGSGIGGMDTIALSVVPMINEGRVRRLGSRIVEQVDEQRHERPHRRTDRSRKPGDLEFFGVQHRQRSRHRGALENPHGNGQTHDRRRLRRGDALYLGRL